MQRDYNGFGHLIIFGGYSAKAHTGHGDVWSLALHDSIWSRMSHKNSSSLRIEPRYSHTAIMVDDLHGSIISPVNVSYMYLEALPAQLN